MSHPTRPGFSPGGIRVGATLAILAGALTLTTSTWAQDESPLDRQEDFLEPEDQAPVQPPQPTHQPGPSAPVAAPHHHHHPTDQGRPAPQGPQVVGYDERSSPRVGLVVGGSIMLGLGYGIPLAIVAGADFRNETQWLAVPVVGPWITMGRMRYGSCSNRRFVADDCDDAGERAGDVLGAVALGFTGLIQAGGLAMLVTGVAAQKTKVVPIYAVAPMPVREGMGMMMTGSF